MALRALRGKSSSTRTAGDGRGPGWRQNDHSDGALVLTSGVSRKPALRRSKGVGALGASGEKVWQVTAAAWGDRVSNLRPRLADAPQALVEVI